MRDSSAAWRRIGPFISGSRRQIVLIAVVSVVAGLAEAVLLTLIATLAMVIAEGTDTVTVQVFGLTLTGSRVPLLWVSLAVAVVRGLLQLWVAYLPAKMSGQAMARLRQRLFDAFVGATWETKASEREGGFQSLMINQINATAQTITVISATVSSALMFATLLVSAVALSPAAAAVITGASLGLFAVLRPFARNLRKSSTALSAEGIEYAKTTQDIASMAEETQVFGASTAYRERFYEQLRAVQAPFQHTRFMAAAVPSLYQSAALLVLVVALFVVSMMGGQSMTELGAVVLMLVRAVTYGQRVQTSITTIDEKVPFMLHLADAIERYEGSAEAPGIEPVEAIRTIGMADVRFSYGEHEVLHGVSFTVDRGEIIGIVGPSGAGKSTLVQILLRLREPTAGALLVNGIDATRVLRSDWRSLVAYVPQMPQLVYGTVRDNIRFFRNTVSDQDIEDAARRAQVHDDIMALSDGYDTVVGQRAAAVSGGQAQRICLARALAARPTVIILDEPTSALDVKSEGLVQESLRESAKDAVVFLVAHRLSTLSICHRVMVINHGELEAFATTDQLVQANRFFKEVTDITETGGSYRSNIVDPVLDGGLR